MFPNKFVPDMSLKVFKSLYGGITDDYTLEQGE
jgi:hypothetical protein